MSRLSAPIASPSAPASPESLSVPAEARLQTAPGKEDGERAVTLRAVLIGLVCAVALCAITPYNDFKIAATYIAGTQFPLGAVFVLLVLAAGVNVALRRWAPSRVFRRGELLTIWTLILVASGLPSSGLMRYFLPSIPFALAQSDATNGWEAKVWGGVPDWLKFHDTDAATAYFKGYPRGQEHVPWAAWVGPLAAWGTLAILFLLVSFCMASLMRRQWVENEKFSFPLVTLPVLLAEDPEPGRSLNPLLRTPLFWLSFAFVTCLHTVRGLHLMYPSIPDIVISWNLMDFLKVRPWDSIGPLQATVWPIVIGLSYLLSAEVCFSLWFFHLFYKAEILLCTINNWDAAGPVGGIGYKQFHALQAFGGGVGLLIWTAWTGRTHLREVWEKATNGPRAAAIDDSRELISYRATLIGLLIGYVGIALWLFAAQVPAFMIVLALLMTTLAIVTISWAVCQAGLLFMSQPYATTDLLATIFGTGPFKIAPWYTSIRYESAFLYDTREMMTPSLLMGAKTADAAHFDARALCKAMAVSVALGLIVSCIMSIALPYYNGGANSLNNPYMYSVFPRKPLSFLAGAASLPFKGSWTNALHCVAGFLGVFGLLLLRARFNVGIHPIGFLCASVYSMHTLWFSIFLGWLFKTLIQRYGGMKGYRGFLPVFLGFILGDVVNAVVWIVLGNLTGVGYQITPN